MKALVFHGPYDVRLEEVPESVLPHNYVLIRVVAVGICGTDIAIYKGTLRPRKLPIVLGHEFSGIIYEVGKGVRKELMGRRVVAEINITCGLCWFCKHGLRNHCTSRRSLGIDLDGAMAEYVAVPVDNIHFIPSEVNLEEAALVEPLAAILQMAKRVDIKVGYTVVILGLGPIGLLSLQIARLEGATNIIAVDLLEDRLRLAEKLGADMVLNLAKEGKNGVIDRVLRFTKGKGADVVIEATGNPKALDLAIELVKPTGIIAAKSTHGLPTTFDYTRMVVKEISIVGSRCGPFDLAIDILRKGLIDVRALISHKLPLYQAKRAFDIALERKGIKIIIKP